MNRLRSGLVIYLCAIFVSSSFRILSAGGPQQDERILKINKAYDKRTLIKKSTIPNAGNGLFAAVKIKKGDVIGELGGRLVAENDRSLDNHYIAAIPECAWAKNPSLQILGQQRIWRPREPNQFCTEQNQRHRNAFSERGDQASL